MANSRFITTPAQTIASKRAQAQRKKDESKREDRISHLEETVDRLVEHTGLPEKDRSFTRLEGSTVSAPLNEES